jgi:hypothetical protein
MFLISKILKQAWHIVRTHKFLWVFGLFLIIGSVQNTASYSIQGVERDEFNNAEFIAWASTHLTEVILISLGIVVIGTLVTLISSIGEAGIIVSVRQIVEKQEVGFMYGLKVARTFFLRVLGTKLLGGIFILFTVLVLGLPVVFLLFIDLPGRAMLLGVVAALIFLPLLIFISLAIASAPVFVVLNNLKVWQATKASIDLVWTNFGKLFSFGIAVGIIELVVIFLGSVAALLVAGLIVQLIGISDDLIGFIISAIIFVGVGAVLAAWGQTAWTLAVMELVKPVKVEEVPNAVPVSEAAN